jgi:hypothetical protein
MLVGAALGIEVGVEDMVTVAAEPKIVVEAEEEVTVAVVSEVGAAVGVAILLVSLIALRFLGKSAISSLFDVLGPF